MKLGPWAETERSWVLEDTSGLLNQLLLQPTASTLPVIQANTWCDRWAFMKSGQIHLTSYWALCVWRRTESWLFCCHCVVIMITITICFACLLWAKTPRTMFESYLIPTTMEIMKVDRQMTKNGWNFENTMVFFKKWIKMITRSF